MKLPRIAESWTSEIKTFLNRGKRQFAGVDILNEIELVQTKLGGYHVYVAAWEHAVGQILPDHQAGGNIYHPYAVAVVEISNTPIDNDVLYSM